MSARAASHAASGSPGWLHRHGSSLLTFGLLVAIALLILPLPSVALDLAIGMSFGASLILLAAAVHSPGPTAVSTFPALLLMVTVLRLAITIASTRLILLHAHAGGVIDAFGRLMVGGNVLVGGVVFVVLSAVQFIVIAKGADRVAEVSARFTLDGIPGRQMSIDADQRAGTLTPAQATQMRQALDRETHLYGAMDGAMKFIKGDSIATLLVAAVNIAGGLGVGVMQRGLDLGQALQTYTLLTIGDGLVAQIPSLLCSLAAGIMVTRITHGEDRHGLGQEVFAQLRALPQALVFAAIGVAALTLLAGRAALPLLGLALALAALAWRVSRRRTRKDVSTAVPSLAREGMHYTPHLHDALDLGTSTPLRVRLSPDALQALRAEVLEPQIAQLRRQLLLRFGLPFPGLSLGADAALPPGSYVLDLDELPRASNTLVPGARLAASADPGFAPGGTPGYRPGHAAAFWVAADDPAAADAVGPEQVLAEHLQEFLERHAASFIGTQELRFLLDQLATSFPELVALLEARYTAAQLVPLLQGLLARGIGIRNLRRIFEALLAVPANEATAERMLREARIALGPQWLRAFLRSGNPASLPVMVLDPDWQQALAAWLRIGIDGEPELAPPPELLAQWQQLTTALDRHSPPLLVPAALRPHLEQWMDEAGKPVAVLAVEELPRHGCRIDVQATLQP